MRLLGKLILIVAGLFFTINSYAQFYNGLNQTFGKNRVQYEEFFWTYYRFQNFEYYFYPEGKKAADFAAKTTPKIVYQQQKFLDYYLNTKLYFLIYTNISDFRQSNIGINDDQNGMGGVTHISGNKIFLYFNGDYESFENQISRGVASIMVNQMMFGENWKEVIKNSALLSIPDWYTKGLVSYAANPWNVSMDGYLRDAIISGRFKKYNRLSEKDAEIAGHSLWNYIAEVYGQAVIPNILYMARVSKNIESGFLFVLGVGLNELIDESQLYYKVRYEIEDEVAEDPIVEAEPIKTRKTIVYDQWTINTDETFGGFTTNKLGKTKVYLYNSEKEKKKKVYKKGYKLDRINDYKQPILAWHPDGKIMAIVTEKKGKPMLGFYNLEDKKTIWREIFKVDKVYDATFSSTGDYLVMSAVQKSQSDIYTLKLSSNVIEQITNDIFDDKHPRFIDNDTKIIFSSNRQADTLNTNPREDAYNNKVDNWDVFTIDLNSKSKQLERLSNTPNIDEFYASQIKKDDYTWVSDENGVFNRYLVTIDSAIASIDTTINYRYFPNTNPVTNYKRNIQRQYFPVNSENYAQALTINNKYKMYSLSKSETITPLGYKLDLTKFRESELQKIEESKPKENTANTDEQKLIYTRVKVFEDNQTESVIDIDNYQFDENTTPTKKAQQENIPTNSRFITLKSKTDKSNLTDEVELPQQRNYFLNFVASDLITTVDFDFANQIYQPFNGGPWTNPGMGTVAKVELYDLFEDYKVVGGLRYAFNNNNREFFFSLENRLGRLDKKYSLQRQGIISAGNTSVYKVVIHQLKYDLNYAFNEVIGLRSTLSLRNDRNIVLSTDRRALQAPDTYINWMGAKFELVFDNVIDRGLNLYNGSRWKIFYERYQQIDDFQTDINIVGVDFRHYQKIHRDLIWAFRFAGSTSFGNRKLVYYLGAVDNWFTLSQDPDNPKFNPDTRIAQDQNYYFQAIATNMRGFQQNIRNGNSFALVNNEIRWPIFKYFANKPIKSEFWGNFQIVGFTDVGTAWTGQNPFSDENTFNTVEIIDGPVTVRLDNKKNPIVGSYGVGLRSKLWGYFGRLDYGYGIEDGKVLDPRVHLSFGLDF